MAGAIILPNPNKRSKTNLFVVLDRPTTLSFYYKWTGIKMKKIMPKVQLLMSEKAKEYGWDIVEFSDGFCILKKSF